MKIVNKSYTTCHAPAHSTICRSK